MTVYPSAIDDDRTIIRIDDNLSELGGTAINQLRESTFSIEKTIGINPQGSKSSVADRLNTFFNPDGTPRGDVLISLGVVSLPITNNQVGINAGILETKLSLNYSTTSLNTAITIAQTQVNNLSILFAENQANLAAHISGAITLSNGDPGRHVASHIDINTIPYDPRDVSYSWTGLLDKNGIQRSATQVASALLEINNDLINHENSITITHYGTAVAIDSSQFTQLPTSITNVQEAIEAIDLQETTIFGIDRATLNANGIPRHARSQNINGPDGYNINIVPSTRITSFLAEPTQQSPQDSIINGDDVISFLPDNTGYLFDSKFTNVRVGDMVRVNYGNGIEAIFPISSIRYNPGSEWIIRINGYNLKSGDGYARIDRPRFDNHTQGIFAASAVIPDINPDLGCNTYSGSILIGSPRGATAVGIGFDPNQLDINHYNLYLRMYPSGNPSVYVDLPEIDVTGNAGTTPGAYSIETIVEATNKQFRHSGFNYRFMAFNHKGEFGVMLADAINNVSFTIISGAITGTYIDVGSYNKNVIGTDDRADGYDALGLGYSRSMYATPVGTYISGEAAAAFPTLIIQPVAQRNVLTNGVKRDYLNKANKTLEDGYWNAVVTNVTDIMLNNTTTIEYTISQDLSSEKLYPGKTIVIQPVGTPGIDITAYGRFIIGYVAYNGGNTIISVINGMHASVNPIGTPIGIGTNVKLYFSNDSVGIDANNLVGAGIYHRYNEVYADQFANTFAIERARMNKQSISGVLLDTSIKGWRIRKVSPKFSGYAIDNTGRRFVRLLISSWNSVTGEFQGTLGQGTGSSLTDLKGPLTTGKKNHPVRFYDASYVNYIDIEFFEYQINPGSVLLPDTTERYVDIEIFQGLSSNDEYFVIAGISHDEKEIVAITELRQFGTLSERNFTDSAISFITAGERYLHANGIIRGFEFLYQNVAAVLTFSGGLALVNGKFIAVDSLNVKLPEITNGTTSFIEDYFICLTENGQLIAVKKYIGSEFFDSRGGYYAETLTFKEIVDYRKDLTIIAVINYHLLRNASPYLHVYDARRFIDNESINEFSWTNQDGYIASFHTQDAVENWINEYSVDRIKIKYLKLDNNTNSIFFEPNRRVTLEGGIIEIISLTTGFVISSSDVELKDCSIYYYPDTSGLVANDIVNAVDIDDVPLFAVGIDDLSLAFNISITNCKFYSNSTQRPPFIGCASMSNSTYSNIKVCNNLFKDDVAQYNVAIGFFKSNILSTGKPTFKNILISGNVCNWDQTIMLSSVASGNQPDGSFTNYSYVRTNNVIIENNIIGGIGLMSQGDGISYIKGNTISDIIATGITATLNTTTNTYGRGYSDSSNADLEINDNKSSYIYIPNLGVNTLSVPNNLIVSKNILYRESDTLKIKYLGIVGSEYRAIHIQSRDASNYLVSDNIIEKGESGQYSDGIYISGIGKSVISGNSISNFTITGISVFSKSSNINGNIITRNDNNITDYIYISPGSSNVAVFDNIFDSCYKNASLTVSAIDNFFSTANNINQVASITLDSTCVLPGIGGSSSNFTSMIYANSSYIASVSPDTFYHSRTIRSLDRDAGTSRIYINSTTDPDDHAYASFIYPLYNILPLNCFILNIIVSFSWSGTLNAGVTDQKIIGYYGNTEIGNVLLDGSSSGTQTFISDRIITWPDYPSRPSINQSIKRLTIGVESINSSSIFSLYISSPIIRFVY